MVNWGRAYIENWAWNEIAECRLDCITLNQHDFTVFFMTTYNGDEELFGLDDEPGRAEEIAACVHVVGKELKRSFPSSAGQGN